MSAPAIEAIQVVKRYGRVTALDGISVNEGVVFVFTTNCALDLIDRAFKRPGRLERKEDPTLAVVIDRYIAESKNVVHGTKAQVFKTLKNSDLGEIKSSEITSRALVSFAQELNKSMEPQTCGNYFSHLSNIFTVARPAWDYPLSRQEFDDAVTVLKKLGLIRKGGERDQ